MGVYIRQTTAVKKRGFPLRIGGFTMAELMIAVGIIALLTIAGFVTMQNQARRARDQRRQADLEQIRQALEQFRLASRNREYPITADGQPHEVLTTELGRFLPRVPRDPSNSPTFKYWYNSISGERYELCARLETQPQIQANACGRPFACGSVSGENCSIELTQP